MELLHTFLSENFSEKFVFKQKNVSRDAYKTLAPDVEVFLRAARENEFLLYYRLLASDGYSPPASKARHLYLGCAV